MVASGGEYFMEISIGTPKIKVLGNADTGSDLTWIQTYSDKRCDVKRNVCGYKYLYGDGSFSEGNIGSEKFAIALSTGHPVSFLKIIFGCGHSNVSLFDEVGSGIIGIGGGPLSLISQLGHNVVSTPLIDKEPKTFYYVTLEATKCWKEEASLHK
ncbi:hypothetical protein EZV62_019842 [Acer yangbiense]|uniref:Peptidase A1 domain-containing protein n=1 Tax=Acer yangbiense TaxID=1000413 RepID=A0A5C7HEF6_9ROSI|nr:hypothetical protein EZV62_019842 [Acer yangbiense]